MLCNTQELNSREVTSFQCLNSGFATQDALGDGNKFAGFAFLAILSLVSSFLVSVLRMIPGVGKHL